MNEFEKKLKNLNKDQLEATIIFLKNYLDSETELNSNQIDNLIFENLENIKKIDRIKAGLKHEAWFNNFDDSNNKGNSINESKNDIPNLIKLKS